MEGRLREGREGGMFKKSLLVEMREERREGWGAGGGIGGRRRDSGADGAKCATELTSEEWSPRGLFAVRVSFAASFWEEPLGGASTFSSKPSGISLVLNAVEMGDGEGGANKEAGGFSLRDGKEMWGGDLAKDEGEWGDGIGEAGGWGDRAEEQSAQEEMDGVEEIEIWGTEAEEEGEEEVSEEEEEEVGKGDGGEASEIHNVRVNLELISRGNFKKRQVGEGSMADLTGKKGWFLIFSTVGLFWGSLSRHHVIKWRISSVSFAVTSPVPFPKWKTRSRLPFSKVSHSDKRSKSACRQRLSSIFFAENKGKPVHISKRTAPNPHTSMDEEAIGRRRGDEEREDLRNRKNDASSGGAYAEDDLRPTLSSPILALPSKSMKAKVSSSSFPSATRTMLRGFTSPWIYDRLWNVDRHSKICEPTFLTWIENKRSETKWSTWTW
jgi:hypothetical protein